MRALRSFMMFLAVMVVVAHSVLTHHHHLQVEAEKHSLELAHHYDQHETDPEDDEHSHGVFSFSQIDDAFLGGKVQFSKLVALPVIFCSQWVTESRVTAEAKEYFIADVGVPASFPRSSVSFRGPPFLV